MLYVPTAAIWRPCSSRRPREGSRGRGAGREAGWTRHRRRKCSRRRSTERPPTSEDQSWRRHRRRHRHFDVVVRFQTAPETSSSAPLSSVQQTHIIAAAQQDVIHGHPTQRCTYLSQIISILSTSGVVREARPWPGVTLEARCWPADTSRPIFYGLSLKVQTAALALRAALIIFLHHPQTHAR